MSAFRKILIKVLAAELLVWAALAMLQARYNG